MDSQMTTKKCGCMHHKTIPAFIVLIGLTFLLGDFGVFSGAVVAWIWPILLILIGLQKLMHKSGTCGCCAAGVPMKNMM